jgi:hypothetical protein
VEDSGEKLLMIKINGKMERVTVDSLKPHLRVAAPEVAVLAKQG